jgi:protease I
MAKVLFILAKEGFRDEEFLVPAEILQNKGHQIFVASNTNKGNKAIGADGAEVIVDVSLDEVNVKDYDMIVFVGGPGALENLDNEKSYRIARETVENKKHLAAICISPTILAQSGVLKNKKATVWSSASYKESIEILKKNGAEYVDEPVVVEDGGYLITANGPKAAKEFGDALSRALEE